MPTDLDHPARYLLGIVRNLDDERTLLEMADVLIRLRVSTSQAPPPSSPTRWRGASFKNELYAKDWVVYANPPFGGPEHVFRYLGRYTHRVAISNHRIVAFADGRVTFLYKDYKQGGKQRHMTLTAVEFSPPLLLHVLPKGFVRIRHYGLCAPSNVHELESAWRLLLTQEQGRSARSWAGRRDADHVLARTVSRPGS